MKELKEAQMGIITVLALMLVSIKRRLPTRRFSSGITTLALAGIVLLVAAGGASADTEINSTSFAGGDYYANMANERYYLTEDLTADADKSGLIIGADGVTIDGAGFKMTGNEDATVCLVSYAGGSTGQTKPAKHSGIINQGFDNVVIKDLEIENFCTGIALGDVMYPDVLNNTVTKCKIHHNGNGTTAGMVTHGIHMVGASMCSITKNEISNNNGTGTSCGSGGNGIFIHGAEEAEPSGDENNITCNNLTYNAKSGLFMKYQCMRCIISYNKASYNGEGGIVPKCEKSNFNTYEYNTMIGNTVWGFYTNGNDNTIRFNTIHSDTGIGLELGAKAGQTGNNVVTNNSVCNANGQDIVVALPGNNTGDSNTCDNGLAGWCDWNCDNPVSVYFDYDKDDCYSGDLADCSCNVPNGTCACCNPGSFNTTHADDLNGTIPAIVWLTAGDDINDCDPSITTAVNWYCDGDSDTYISLAVSGSGAPGAMPSGCQLAQGNDCDDGNSAVNPGATENCTNGIDDDCDGDIDCLDSYCKPDLDITVKTEEWVNDTHYNVNYTVCNIGICDAVASSTSIYIDEILKVNDPVGILTENQCHTSIVGPFLWTASSDNVTVCADGGGLVDEKDETNNCEINTLNYQAVGIEVGDPYPSSAPNDCVNGIFCVDINVTPNGLPVYGVQYKLTYNPSVIYVLSQDEGTFLSHNGNNTAETRNYLDTVNGYSEYGLTRIDSLLGETTPGTLVKVKYKTIGSPEATSWINLSEVVVSDNNADELGSTLVNGSVTICPANQPPDANCSVDHKYNNAGYGMTTFNGTESTDGGANLLNHFFTWQTHTHTGNLLGMVVDDFYDVSCYNGTCYDPFGEYLYLTDAGGLLDTCTCEVIVYIAGDANGDCKVNILDASMTGLRWNADADIEVDYPGVCWGMTLPSPSSDADMADRADLNNDCKVNILDTSIVGLNWGDTCQGTC